MSGHDLRVGVDIGGTFTDIVGYDAATDALYVQKVPSRPDRPALAVIDGLERLLDEAGCAASDVSLLSHGSTVTVNTLIERSGPTTGVLVTEGFDAIPVAGTGDRPLEEVKNPRYAPPARLVPQRLVRGVPERVGADGAVLEALDEQATREAVRDLRREGVESIAVALLFAFVTPDHERRVRELIAEEHPDCAVSLSSEIAPRIREYPRLSTTAVNAYVDPTLTAYLDELEATLAAAGIDPATTSMMLSHGGVTDFETATDAPVRTLLSGPAAGVQGAVFTAGLVGVDDVVMMDMGGTSCDVAIAPGAEPLTTTEQEFDRNPIAVRMIDIRSIGAGGGTIATVENGRLQVGPASAGADPGPVCYDLGGGRVTVTDADAVLGRLNPDAVLGEDIHLDVDAARAAIEAQIADPLGLTVPAAAAGIVDVINDKMKKELALALTKRGHDPRAFSLVAYGGAGPMHAGAIARELSIRRLVIPSLSGINSAVGLLTSDRKRLFERSRIEPLADAAVEDVFADLEAAVEDELRASGVDPADAAVERELELRYEGQSYELGVPYAPGDSAAAITEAFTAAHREAFGHTSDQPLETMTYTIVTRLATERLDGRQLEQAATGPAETAPSGTRPVYFDGETVETAVYGPDDVAPGSRLDGPAIIERPDTTIVIEPGNAVTVDRYGNALIDVAGGDR